MKQSDKENWCQIDPFTMVADNETFKQWCLSRSKIYASLGKSWPNIKEIFVEFGKPEDGWIDTDIYADGENMCTVVLSYIDDPVCRFKKWLEKIIVGSELCRTFYIDREGSYYCLMYESLQRAKYSANKRDVGLFYIYSTGSDKMLFSAVCDTRQFVAAFYRSLQHWHNMCTPKSLSKWDLATSIALSDYEEGDEKIDIDKFYWEYYNKYIRSSLVEFYISEHSLPHDIPKFKEVYITERMHIWPEEASDALFWAGAGIGCGTADYVITDNHGTINFEESLPELRVWFSDYEHLLGGGAGDQWNEWYKRGEELAKRVREILPDDIELFYMWKELPKIVFNEKLIKEKR